MIRSHSANSLLPAMLAAMKPIIRRSRFRRTKPSPTTEIPRARSWLPRMSSKKVKSFQTTQSVSTVGARTRSPAIQ